MADRTARVRIDVTGGQKVRSEVRGVADESIRQSRRVAAEAEKSGRQQAAASRRAAQEQIRIQREASREAQRIAKQEAIALKQLRRDRLAALGGFALGLGGYGLAQARGMGAALGVRSREENLSRAVDFGLGLTRLSVNAGLSPERQAALRGRILRTSDRTGVESQEILGGLTVAQSRFAGPGFDALEYFSGQMERLAQVSKFTGASVEDVVGTVGEFQRQMGVTAAQVPELIGMMVSASNQGSIEFQDISRTFAVAIGQFARATGKSQMEGAREASALFQMAGRGGMAPEMTRTAVGQLLRSTVETKQRRKLQALVGRGVNVNNMGDVIGALSSSRLSGQQMTQRLQGVFGREEAAELLGLIVQQTRADRAAGRGDPFQAIAAASAGEGNAKIDEFGRRWGGSAEGQAANMANQANNLALRNSEEMLTFAREVAGPLARLQSEFPRLTMAVEALTVALGAAALGNMIGGRGGAGGVAGGIGNALSAAGSNVASAGGRVAQFVRGAGAVAAVGELARRVLPDQTSPEIMAAIRSQRETAGRADPGGANGIFVGQSSGAVNRAAVREMAREMGLVLRDTLRDAPVNVTAPAGSGQSRREAGGPSRRQ